MAVSRGRNPCPGGVMYLQILNVQCQCSINQPKPTTLVLKLARAYVSRGFDNISPASLTIPTATLLAEPSIPSASMVMLDARSRHENSFPFNFNV
eukprot:scaffold179084_cov50-Prasinocladus_malaysianus.AAC.1